MAIPVGTSQRLAFAQRPPPRMTSDQAAELLRQPSSIFKAVTSRPDSRLVRITIPANDTAQVLQAADRHTVRIRNVGSVDLRYAHTVGDAESTDRFGDLKVGEMEKFDIHYSAIEQVERTIQKVVFHCEWSDDMFVNNPNGIAGTIEVFEVY